MGIYLNPDAKRFNESRASKIYVDKTGLIAYTNSVINTEQKFVCVSRPRRFGKSMAIGMLSAYYNCELDTRSLFSDLEISKDPSFENYLNHYEVIHIDMQEFLSQNPTISGMLDDISRCLLWELTKKFPDIQYFDPNNLVRSMRDIYAATNHTFIILIDEWDCLFREFKEDKEGQKQYLDFLRTWLKEKPYVALAYMTGILPIKKYGSHSALNMFSEFSMTTPKGLAEYVGFTEPEVQKLCLTYHMDFDEMKAWYDGYAFANTPSVYSPKSVVEALTWNSFDTYWNQTETYEALKIYIQMNYDGLKDAIIEMMLGQKIVIDTGSFQNDMTSFSCRDDVLTLLVHLGYLSYNSSENTVCIPNREILCEYDTAIKHSGWQEIINAINASQKLLNDILNLDEKAVAAAIDEAHMQTSILQYNNETALSYTISLALYSAKEYYTAIRELPSGKGFADLCFIPRPGHVDKPALVVELKWDKTAAGAIEQIKKRQYIKALEAYQGNLLLVGINYNKSSKKHTCTIEKMNY